MPAADLAVDVPLVRRLLEEQHPDLAGEALRPAANGWDNAVFRLGDGLAVRVPRRAAAAELIGHEQEALPAIARRVPVAVPVPVRIGRPSPAFPWRWSVVPWFDARTVQEAGLRDDLRLADELAAFVRALHVPAGPEAPANPVRGVPLAARDGAAGPRLAALRFDGVERLREQWASALAAPVWPGPPVWLHGDLHPGNLLERDGALAAVIDFGDVTAGDPATDLATAWLTFGPAARARFRERLAPDPATWARARGWAVSIASALVELSEPGTATVSIGLAALQELAREP